MSIFSREYIITVKRGKLLVSNNWTKGKLPDFLRDPHLCEHSDIFSKVSTKPKVTQWHTPPENQAEWAALSPRLYQCESECQKLYMEVWTQQNAGEVTRINSCNTFMETNIDTGHWMSVKTFSMCLCTGIVTSATVLLVTSSSFKQYSFLFSTKLIWRKEEIKCGGIRPISGRKSCPSCSLPSVFSDGYWNPIVNQYKPLLNFPGVSQLVAALTQSPRGNQVSTMV